MKLLAKMKCSQMTDYGNNNQEGTLTAVYGDTEENKSFSMYTPSANLKMMCNNPNAIGFYEPGDKYDYYITIEKRLKEGGNK